MRIIFATGNEGKMREIRDILAGMEAEIVSMKEAGIKVDVVEDGTTFEENGLIKARAIAAHTDAIVLVGNPLWTADLISVMNSPLEGYTNIMYTYHFYAADHKNTSEVEQAYDKGFPVFISEHGGMLSSGDGDLDIEAVTNWYKVLDERNISYVAWNLSNSKGSASILKQETTSLTDFSDEALKEWGVWYKAWVRKKFGFDR